jgi:hypothetical protein
MLFSFRMLFLSLFKRATPSFYTSTGSHRTTISVEAILEHISNRKNNLPRKPLLVFYVVSRDAKAPRAAPDLRSD